MILYFLDFVIGALAIEIARYLFTAYVKKIVAKHEAVIFENLDEKIVSVYNAGLKTALPYALLIRTELSKIKEFESGILSYVPFRNYATRLIQKQFNPLVLLQDIKKNED